MASNKIFDPNPGTFAPPLPHARTAHLHTDSFDKYVLPGDPCEISLDPNSDMVNVKHNPSGLTYRMPVTDAIARGMGGWQQGKVYAWSPRQGTKIPHASVAPPRTEVHVLHQGQPLCHFDNRRPCDWPQGHQWVSLEHIRNAQDDPEAMGGATCYDCIEAARHLLTP